MFFIVLVIILFFMLLLCDITSMRHITFWSRMDHIYDGGPKDYDIII